MQAVILAAGKGVRMRPLTYEVPKPMLRVKDKPILCYTIELLPPEVEEVIFVIGHLGQQIKDYFGASYNGRKITYVEQHELLGTGHALSLCQGLLKGKFLVLMGDDMYSAEDVKRCLETKRCILAKEVTTEERRNYGYFKIDEQGHLLDIVETELEPGQTCLVNTALYVLDQHFFDYPLVPIKDGAEFGLPQTIAVMAKDYPVKIISATSWLPIGFPEDLQIAEKYLEEQKVLN